MTLKRKFNLKNLGCWVGLKKRKKDGNKENVCLHANLLKNGIIDR
jgi:hypothetical protein